MNADRLTVVRVSEDRAEIAVQHVPVDARPPAWAVFRWAPDRQTWDQISRVLDAAEWLDWPADDLRQAPASTRPGARVRELLDRARAEHDVAELHTHGSRDAVARACICGAHWPLDQHGQPETCPRSTATPTAENGARP